MRISLVISSNRDACFQSIVLVVVYSPRACSGVSVSLKSRKYFIQLQPRASQQCYAVSMFCVPTVVDEKR